MNAANASLHASSLEQERRAHEPSMEEILASIRKIIADDDALPLSRPSPAPELRPSFGSVRPFEPKATPFEPKATPFEPKAAPFEPKAAPFEPKAGPFEAELATFETRADIQPQTTFAAPVAPFVASVAPQVEPEPVDAPVTGFAPPAPIDHQPVVAERTTQAATEAALDEAELASFAEIAQELSKQEPGETIAPSRPQLFEERRPEPALRFEQPAALRREQPAPVAPAIAEQGLILSPEATASVATSFQALSASVQVANAEMIERQTRELLRPMLKQWLDDNLPVMVERMVRAEIERVARGGR